MSAWPHSDRGTVSLVALCFVAMLGISLGGYISVCSRAMTLSNRSFQGNLSQQLAELGIEEALRAFNKNDWSDWSSGGVSVDWDTTTHSASKRAVATLSFSSEKFGQGTTATIKIRVDNYDAAHLGSTWSNSVTYRTGDLIGYNGVWYRSVQNNNSNHTPGDLTWWVPAPIPWTWSGNISYSQDDVANYNGTWYRSTTSSNTSTPPTNWTIIPSLYFSWTSGTTYTAGSYVYITDRWYRCVADCMNIMPPNSSYWRTDAPTISWTWRYTTPKTYKFNDVVYYEGKWWRCIEEYTSNNASEYPGNSGDEWEDALTGYAWVSGVNYNLWDTVYYASTGQWYRCVRAHASSGSIPPTNAIYWTNTPLLSTTWDSGRQYSQNDTVRYNGVWYLSLQNSNVAQNPSTASAYWIGANTSNTSYTWNASSTCSAGTYRCYGGVWYKCLISHTNKSPNDTTYWTAAWANSVGVTTGAPVVYAEAVVSIANNPSLTTLLRAPIAPSPLFANAAGATTTLSASSGGTVDSYDSVTDPTASIRGYSAVLAAANTSGTALTLVSSTVKGYIAAPSSTTAPYAPLVSLGTSATVQGASSPSSPKVDTSRVSRSPYIPAFDPLPSGGLSSNWSTVPKGTELSLSSTINLGTPGATTPSRYYHAGSLTIDGSTVSSININGPVILYIQGDLTLSGSTTNVINISSTGSAEIHVGDGLKINQTSGGIVNKTKDPKKLILICDTLSSDTQNYSDGDNDFYGVIYIPNTTNANGLLVDNSSVEIFGAISAKKITYSGANMNIHYDTSLRNATFGGVAQPYAVAEWRELPVTEQATMP